MFNGHTMSLITDISLVANDVKNVDFMLVAYITSVESYEGPNIYYAGVLMPPTEMLMRWAEGDSLILQNEYPKYLMTKDCDDIIVALIASMTKRNVVLYIPQDEFEVYGDLLLRHLYYVYGIICNTVNSQFSVFPEKIPFIMTKFYLMDIMEPNEYLRAYPYNYPLPEIVINKLAAELRPFGDQQRPFVDYQNYFNSIRQPLQAPEKRLMYHLVDKKK